MGIEPERDRGTTDFEKHAGGARQGLIGEFLAFVRENRKWWLLPILAVFLVLGVLVLLGGTAVGPFIYALF